jgi:hypothetical protein
MRDKLILQRRITVVVIILVFWLLIMTMSYVINFWGFRISKKPSDWGAFGDYFNFLISAVNTGAVIILSYLVYKAQVTRDLWEQKHLSLQEKPSLIFVAYQGQFYKLYNMGKGSAHKLIIGRIVMAAQVIENPPYKAYSIPPGGHIVVDWATNSRVLYVYYENEKKEQYLTKCEGDVNEEIGLTDDGHNIIVFLKQQAQRKDQINLVMP